MTKLDIKNLNIKIGQKKICEDLNLSLRPAQTWGVLGRNGTGKTTLLHTIAGLRPAQAGQILLDDTDITQLPRKLVAQKLGLLLQHVEDAFPCNVLDTVVSGRHPHIESWQWESKTDYKKAEQALQLVEMQDFEKRQIDELSGGERQRVSIATLLTQDPNIFLLDEPNSHLDLHYQINILQNLCQYAYEQQRIILMSLHDINLAARFCTHLLFLYDDTKILSGPAEELLTTQNLSELFQHPISIIKNNGEFFYTPA